MSLTTNYYDTLGVPYQLGLEEEVLKKAYYKVSRKYHPDFYTTASSADQDEAMRQSELVNIAYKTLADRRSRIQYVLQSKASSWR
jgi:molecular chaperone HscB